MEEDIWFPRNTNVKYSVHWKVEPGMEAGGGGCGKQRGDKGVLEDGQLMIIGKSKPFRKENILNVLFQCFIKKRFCKAISD